jgi:prevent-host-death family protein
MIIASTEFQNNVGLYLQKSTQEDVVITRNGKEVARLIGSARKASYLMDSIVGLVPPDTDLDREKAAYLAGKY